MSKITSPVLIIHGTEDEVIDFSHGLALFERCPKAVEPLWVEGAGHNDIELYSQYLERLRRFIGQELAVQHAWPSHFTTTTGINVIITKPQLSVSKIAVSIGNISKINLYPSPTYHCTVFALRFSRGGGQYALNGPRGKWMNIHEHQMYVSVNDFVTHYIQTV